MLSTNPSLIIQAQTVLPPCVIVDNYGHDEEAMSRNRQLALNAFRFMSRLLERPDLPQLIDEYVAGNPYSQALLGEEAPRVIHEGLVYDSELCGRFIAEVNRRLENYVPIVCPLCYEQAAMPLCAVYRDPGHDEDSSAENLALAQSHIQVINALLHPDNENLEALLDQHLTCLGLGQSLAPEDLKDAIVAKLRHNRVLCRELQSQILDRQTRRLHPALPPRAY